MSGRELELVEEAFDSNFIAPVGPMLAAFEEEFACFSGIPYCLAVNSATSAMHLAITCLLRRARSLNPDREKQSVFASDLTFIASVSPAIYEGLQPVFIDCDPGTWNMDTRLLEQALHSAARANELPLAVIPTDLYGQCCNLPGIMEICRRFEVPVICDSAESAGASYQCPDMQYRHAGFDADAAVFSFNGNKIITSSGGGMLASHDKGLIDHARKLSTQAREPVAHYEHMEIGYNYRMSNIIAAIGRGQLEVLAQRVERAREIFCRYKELLDLPGIEFMPEPDSGRGNRWLTVVQIDSDIFGSSPEDIRLALEAENIESRPVWKPMHLQPVFAGHKSVGGAVSESIFARGLCLPSGTDMTDSDIMRVVRIIMQLHSS